MAAVLAMEIMQSLLRGIMTRSACLVQRKTPPNVDLNDALEVIGEGITDVPIWGPSNARIVDENVESPPMASVPPQPATSLPMALVSASWAWRMMPVTASARALAPLYPRSIAMSPLSSMSLMQSTDLSQGVYSSDTMLRFVKAYMHRLE
ncbi:hypothetical protein AMTRI_Chr04g183470 [Amborella trichopoda]